MPWNLFNGDGRQRAAERAWEAIPPPPPWRFAATRQAKFEIMPETVDAVNAALHLRRPLLLTGLPGSGKSTLVELIAAEFQLGTVLRWHVTSKSTLGDALFQYDALGRLHATQVEESLHRSGNPAAISRVDRFVTLGPLGTALASPDRPRAVLIDEIDKSDFDLPGDLLNVLELGEFDIPPLVRDAREQETGPDQDDETTYRVRGADRQFYDVPGGVVRSEQFPVIVLTSNGERAFPPPFLRRCVRFEMPRPDVAMLTRIVTGYLGQIPATEQETVKQFARQLDSNQTLAIDQLLNLLYLVTGESAPGSAGRKKLEELILAELNVR